MKPAKGIAIGGILLFLMFGAYVIFPLQNASNVAGENVPSFRSESGFRGLKWGAPPSEHESTVLSDFVLVASNKFLNEYQRKNEKLSLGGVDLNRINYTFLIVDGEDKFLSVEILFDYRSRRGDPLIDNDQLLEILTKEYGPYTGIADTDEAEHYAFENEYVQVFFEAWRYGGWSAITINSKEMQARYQDALEQSEKAEKTEKSNF